MENFVTVTRKKEKKTLTWLHGRAIEATIENSLAKHQVTWLHGPVGCGKTTVCNKVLQNVTYVDASSQLYTQKNGFIVLMERIPPSSTVFIDGVSKDSNKLQMIIDSIQKYPNKFLIIADYLKSIDEGVSIVSMQAPSKTKMVNYATKLIGQEKAVEIYQKFPLNFRDFLNAVDCFHKFGMNVDNHDEFFDSNRTVKNLICKGGTGYNRYIGEGTEEHGHVIDMVASNYATNDIESAARIIDSISLSDHYDSLMYMGNWELLPYLTHHGCVVPSKIMGNVLKPEQLHPGYVWTKYYNQCMRKKLLLAVKTRDATKTSMDHDFLIYLCSMLHNMSFDDGIALLREYKLLSCDLDLMNHLVINKLKGKKLNMLKKALKNGR